MHTVNCSGDMQVIEANAIGTTDLRTCAAAYRDNTVRTASRSASEGQSSYAKGLPWQFRAMKEPRAARDIID